MTAKNSSQLSVVSDLSKATAVREIEIDRLMVSAEETRKTIGYTALEDLAASIRTHGVQEPLLVRIIGGLAGPFEIVAGQRRWLASKIAGKTTCPCIVREMSDAEAAELRIISNLQREDLPPLEEALAFSALLNAPGATVETVAAKLAKSPSYVGRRLKLLDAIEPVREALKAGAIEVGHALELARLDEKQQIRHLSRLNCGYITSAAENNRFACEDDEEFDEDDDLDGAEDVFNEDEDGEAPERPEPVGAKQSQWKPTDASVAELRREIARTTLMVLSKAPFPLGDELPPMACTECPKRSGNAALLFDDCAQDTCTDRDCFDAKVKVWIKYELDQADKAKRKLVMLADGYTGDKLAVSQWDVTVTTGKESCEGQEEAIWINGGKMGHRATICRDPKCKQHKSRNSSLSRAADPIKAKAERKKVLEKVAAEKKYRASLFSVIARAKTPEPKGAVLIELVEYAIGRSDGTLKGKAAELLGWDKALFQGHGDVADKRLRNHLSSLSAGDAVRAALLFAESSELTVHEYSVNAKPEGLEKLARLFDVDVDAVRAGFVDGKPMPSSRLTPAKKAAGHKPGCELAAAIEKAAKKGQHSPKLILSAEAKKRIADAQKKRWANLKKPTAKTTPKKAAKKVVPKAAKKGGAK
jgi:ParB/RepB/Spo0J family partition protein